MPPTLKRYIRIAQHRIRGVPVTPETLREEEVASAINNFKRFLRNKMDLEVWFELVLCSEFARGKEGCSVEFVIDDHHFLVTQQMDTFRLIQKRPTEDVSLQVLSADHENFGDKLLVAIGDALDREESE